MKNSKWVFIGLLLAFSPVGVLAQLETADDHYNSGVAYAHEENYDLAIINYDKAILLKPELIVKVAPRLAQVYGKRGAMYYLNGEYAKAVADFTEARKLAQDDPKISKALALAEKARKSSPQRTPAPAAYPRTAKTALKVPVVRQTAPPASAKPKKKQGSVGVWIFSILMLLTPMLLISLHFRKQIAEKPGDIDLDRSGPALEPDELSADAVEPPDVSKPDLGDILSSPGLAPDELPPAAVEPPEVLKPDQGGILSLMREEKYEEARGILARKKHLELSDYNLFLEIYIKLDDFIRAKLTVSQIAGEIQNKPGSKCEHELYLSLAGSCREKGEVELAGQLRQLAVEGLLKALSVRDIPQKFYELALSMEKEGETGLALKIYRQFADAGKDYLDVAQRFKTLKKQSGAKARSQPGKRNPAQSPGSTGAQVLGSVLDARYELKGLLGEGGMGVVYEAWDRQVGRKAAIKRMHSRLKEYPEEYGRFKREAEIVERLRHPNIIGVHGVIEHGGEIYLVFDHIDGKPLSAVLKEKKQLPLKDCKNIFKDICEAVHYAHKNNVIHRDLKPANIMLDSRGRAMVMDFGLASELREGLTRVTHQTMSGTPAYMAPEQNIGTVKRESDIYAMGVCLYEVLTGGLPFTGGDVLAQKKAKDYREATAIVSWLPTGVDGVISRALEPEPSMRFADAMDFWDALKDL